MALYYPPVAFHFRVDFLGLSTGDLDASFQKVSGINSQLGSFEHQEGGENRFKHRLPDVPSFGNLVMERGVFKDSELISWFRDSLETFLFNPLDIIVSLLDEEHNPLESWQFYQAYPVKWEIGSFDAKANEIAIETIELSYQYFNRLN
ncbi:MAG: phage tail protein [Cyclobacteriaceae bacterium]|nr:phage tail protein [Cyclobacteriaceae bacterium]